MPVGFYLVMVEKTNAGLEGSSTQARVVVCSVLGGGGLVYYDLGESCSVINPAGRQCRENTNRLASVSQHIFTCFFRLYEETDHFSQFLPILR